MQRTKKYSAAAIGAAMLNILAGLTLLEICYSGQCGIAGTATTVCVVKETILEQCHASHCFKAGAHQQIAF